MSDGLALIRTLGALLTVLGILAGALWAVRRYNLVLPGTGLRTDKRLAVVERLSLDPRRSLALLRRDGVEHLVLLAPEGHLVIETRIAGVAPAVAAGLPEPTAPAAGLPAGTSTLLARVGDGFGALIERAMAPAPVPSPKVASSRPQSAGSRRRASARG